MKKISFLSSNIILVCIIFTSCFSLDIDNRFVIPNEIKNTSIEYIPDYSEDGEDFYFDYLKTTYHFRLPKKLNDYNIEYDDFFQPIEYPEFSSLDEDYRNLILNTADAILIDDLVFAFIKLREKSDCDIVQLMTAFVQSIPYDHNATYIKSPVETLKKNTGDCDEKSILLAKLLGYAGYKCNLLAFTEARHMALGIVASDNNQSYISGNVYIETTGRFPIGTIPESFKNDINLSSEKPVVIPLNIFGSEYLIQDYAALKAFYDKIESKYTKLYFSCNIETKEMIEEIVVINSQIDQSVKNNEQISDQIATRRTELINKIKKSIESNYINSN